MLSITCWVQTSEFRELLALRVALCVRLSDRRDLDASAVERIQAVIESCKGLLAQIMAVRQSVLDSLAETEAQRRFARGLGGTVTIQSPSHHLDMKA